MKQKINYYDKMEQWLTKAEEAYQKAETEPGDTKALARSATAVKIGTMALNNARFLDIKSQLKEDGTRKS